MEKNNEEHFGKVAIFVKENQPIVSTYQVNNLNAGRMSEMVAELEIIKNSLLELIKKQKIYS